MANLTMVAVKVGLSANTDGDTNVGSAFRSGLDFVPARLTQILALALLTLALLAKCSLINKAFRTDF